MKNIVIGNINIPVYEGNLGVMVSGGADSALLLYILLSNSKGTLYLFTTAKNKNGRSSAISSSLVIEKCIELTGNNNIIHNTQYTEYQNNEILYKLPFEYKNNGVISNIYSAVTANPPKDIADSFCGEEFNTEHSVRDPSVKRDIVCYDVICPFTNANKKEIAEMYKILNLTNTLFPITRSCEQLSDTAITHHCNSCWWCKEREWGFGKL